MKWILTLIVILFALTSCTAPQTQPTPAPVSTDTALANMPNPASAYCEEQGYKSEIRTAADGSQSGVCIFPDGSECDEWAYFRGECGPTLTSNGDTHRHFQFHILHRSCDSTISLHACRRDR